MHQTGSLSMDSRSPPTDKSEVCQLSHALTTLSVKYQVTSSPEFIKEQS